MTGFSQLVSRLCHPLTEVYTIIRAIIVRLLSSYPQQTLWLMIAVSKVNYSNCGVSYVLSAFLTREKKNLVSFPGSSRVPQGALSSNFQRQPYNKERQTTASYFRLQRPWKNAHRTLPERSSCGKQAIFL